MFAKHWYIWYIWYIWYQVVASKIDLASLCQVILQRGNPRRHRGAGAGHPVMTIQVHASDLAGESPVESPVESAGDMLRALHPPVIG